jgi:hypothetical protein
MQKLIASLLVGLIASSSVLIAAEGDGLSLSVTASAIETSARQTPAIQSAEESKPWIERHPVWFGLIAGASVGATWGALSCRKGCFPIGAGGAAIIGSLYGAGPGALIGWGVGRSK